MILFNSPEHRNIPFLIYDKKSGKSSKMKLKL